VPNNRAHSNKLAPRLTDLIHPITGWCTSEAPSQGQMQSASYENDEGCIQTCRVKGWPLPLLGAPILALGRLHWHGSTPEHLLQ
jgi:hypothetical protein